MGVARLEHEELRLHRRLPHGAPPFVVDLVQREAVEGHRRHHVVDHRVDRAAELVGDCGERGLDVLATLEARLDRDGSTVARLDLGDDRRDGRTPAEQGDSRTCARDREHQTLAHRAAGTGDDDDRDLPGARARRRT